MRINQAQHRVRIHRGWFLAALVTLVSGCGDKMDSAVAVRGFELERYLGTWYEIARLDHRFERGLSHVQARYSLRDDGGISVVNKGFNAEKSKWSEAEGKAYFVEESDIGRLKVSFFGPFYGAYTVVDLDPDYRFALVAGPNTKYLWILARDPLLEPAIVDRLLAKAELLGFPTDQLIYPEHDGSAH